MRNLADILQSGSGVTQFKPSGAVAGSYHPGFFGDTVYSGMPTNAAQQYREDVLNRMYSPAVERTVPQETPMPTQVAAAPVEIYDLGDAYYIPSLLDRTPQGLLEVGGEPFDFEAANRAFRRRTATRPSYFQDPYDIEGMSLLG